MTEIFITDIQTKAQADKVLSAFKKVNPQLKVNYDLNETNSSFTCGQTVLSVEGDFRNSEKILAIKGMGFNCEILEDKVCIKQ